MTSLCFPLPTAKTPLGYPWLAYALTPCRRGTSSLCSSVLVFLTMLPSSVLVFLTMLPSQDVHVTPVQFGDGPAGAFHRFDAHRGGVDSVGMYAASLAAGLQGSLLAPTAVRGAGRSASAPMTAASVGGEEVVGAGRHEYGQECEVRGRPTYGTTGKRLGP